jgi:hypothetical protein
LITEKIWDSHPWILHSLPIGYPKDDRRFDTTRDFWVVPALVLANSRRRSSQDGDGLERLNRGNFPGASPLLDRPQRSNQFLLSSLAAQCLLIAAAEGELG